MPQWGPETLMGSRDHNGAWDDNRVPSTSGPMDHNGAWGLQWVLWTIMGPRTLLGPGPQWEPGEHKEVEQPQGAWGPQWGPVTLKGLGDYNGAQGPQGGQEAQ